MKLVIQRTTQASVSVDNITTGCIKQGLVVLFGAGQNDTTVQVDKLVEKTVKLRIFNDEAGKMNRSLIDIQGEMLIISQFTLYADTRKGTRPGFTKAAPPDLARRLYEYFIEQVARYIGNSRVQTGRFGCEMNVDLINQGPVTIILQDPA